MLIKMMNKIMHILFLSCLKATELIEKKLHFKLLFKEKLQLKMHKMMCGACSNYEKQSLLIEMGIAQQDDKTETVTNIDMNEFEKTIHAKITK